MFERPVILKSGTQLLIRVSAKLNSKFTNLEAMFNLVLILSQNIVAFFKLNH